jgi:shikimate kinase
MVKPVCRVNDLRLIGVTGSGKTTVGMDLTKQLGRKFCADNVVTFSFTSHVNDLVRAA